VIDAFFISPYLFGHIPRRVRYIHSANVENRGSQKPNVKDRETDGSKPATLKPRPDLQDLRSRSYMEQLSEGRVKGLVTPNLGREMSGF
jgi:hypothetical protein